MSHHTLSQSSAAQQANPGAVTYHGKHPDGRLRITIGRQKALLHGALYRLTKKTTASGQIVTKRRLVHTTPGHQPDMLDACNLIAIGTKTSHRYRIIGQIEFCEPKLDSAENPSNPAPIVVLDAAGTHRDAHISRDNRTMEKRTQRHLRVLQRELECLQHQLRAGLDPMLSIALAIHITGRSRATLYRDFGKALPRPTKIGRSSRLPYSDVQRYMGLPSAIPTASAQL